MLIEPAPHIVQPRTVTGFYAAPGRSQKRRWKETAGARESLFRDVVSPLPGGVLRRLRLGDFAANISPNAGRANVRVADPLRTSQDRSFIQPTLALATCL